MCSRTMTCGRCSPKHAQPAADLMVLRSDANTAAIIGRAGLWAADVHHDRCRAARMVWGCTHGSLRAPGRLKVAPSLPSMALAAWPLRQHVGPNATLRPASSRSAYPVSGSIRKDSWQHTAQRAISWPDV
jgi:hypothetical protein